MPFPSISKKILHKISVMGKNLPTVIFPTEILTPAYFESLKTLERHTSGHRRVQLDFNKNHSAALALPYSTESLAQAKTDVPELLRLAKNNIIEHASRRVDLFFYTLIAYYHTNALPVEGRTTLQHGKGRTTQDNINITQACHSSILPGLLDQSIFRKKQKSLVADTHFFENLNATVELPPFVNTFDNLLEAICRSESLTLLRKVSTGIINPIQGLEQFLLLMNSLLNDFKQQAASTNYTCLRHSSLLVSLYVHPKLIDLVIEGTLSNTFSLESQSVNKEYVQLLLRMNSEEKRLCKSDIANMYLRKILDLQEEILNSKKTQANKLG